MCNNCGSVEGPFSKQHGITVCKNTKGQIHKENGCTCRITQCVQRRTKSDIKKYDIIEKG